MLFLGAIPQETEIGRLGDMGKTFTKNETTAAKAFDKVVDAILVRLNGSEAPSQHQNL